MAEHFAFFNSVNRDRAYDADHFAAFFADIISTGVSAAGDNLAVTAAGGMQIAITPGHAWLMGRHYHSDSTIRLSLNVGGALPRMDRIVVRTDFAARTITAQVLEGTPAASPTPPGIRRDGDYVDIGLACVTVAKDAISFTDSSIEDTRADNEVCGIVRCLVEHIDVWEFIRNSKARFDESLEDWLRWVAEFKSDTRLDFSQLRDEQEAEFRSWFDGLVYSLDGDVAANLYNKLYAHENSLVTAQDGVHGFRVKDGGGQFYNNGLWQGIAAGFAPPNVSNLQATADQTSVSLKWTDPEDIVYQSLPLAAWKGTRVLRREDRFPEHEQDGVLVKDSTVRNAHASSALVDGELHMDSAYYYGLFPYSDIGIVRRDVANRVQVNTLSHAGTPLGDLPTGSMIRINENGVPANFKIAQHDYIQSGVTAIERDLCLADTVQLNSGGVNTYNGGELDTFLTGAYRNRLDQDVRDSLVTVNIPTTPGNGNYNLTTITRSVFVLSGTEKGVSYQSMAVEGSRVDIYTDNASRIKYSDDTPTRPRDHWTRSARTDVTNAGLRILNSGNAASSGVVNSYYIAPVLTLPSSFPITKDMIVT